MLSSNADHRDAIAAVKGRTGLAVIAAATALLAGPTAAAQEACVGAGPARLTLQVNGIRPAKGEVAVTVYPDNRRRFLAPGGKLLRQRVKAASPVSRACFDLPAGTYAVAVYHDVDGDRDFDRTIVGLPAEGFAFTNDPSTKTGLPPLDSVRFALPAGGRNMAVQMRYLR
jgi:uncharacterized protein (DUF2141 family)